MRELSIQDLAFVYGGVNATNGSVIGGNEGLVFISNGVTHGDINTSGRAASEHLSLPFPFSFPFSFPFYFRFSFL
jgi:hypothetical protein